MDKETSTIREMPMGCPFCGTEPKVRVPQTGAVIVHCDDHKRCAVRPMVFAKTEAAGIKIWNTRVGVPRAAVMNLNLTTSMN